MQTFSMAVCIMMVGKTKCNYSRTWMHMVTKLSFFGSRGQKFLQKEQSMVDGWCYQTTRELMGVHYTKYKNRERSCYNAVKYRTSHQNRVISGQDTIPFSCRQGRSLTPQSQRNSSPFSIFRRAQRTRYTLFPPLIFFMTQFALDNGSSLTSLPSPSENVASRLKNPQK